MTPCLPRSLPWRTWTRSPFLSLSRSSQHLRGQRDDPHEPAFAQLAADGAEDAGPAGREIVLDQHGGVLVEADVAAVGAPLLLGGADDDALARRRPS